MRGRSGSRYSTAGAIRARPIPRPMSGNIETSLCEEAAVMDVCSRWRQFYHRAEKDTKTIFKTLSHLRQPAGISCVRPHALCRADPFWRARRHTKLVRCGMHLFHTLPGVHRLPLHTSNAVSGALELRRAFGLEGG